MNRRASGALGSSHHVTRVEVCGGIAAGKTTLAGLFSPQAAAVVKEEYASNPFWKRFYLEPQRYSFETEVSFLIQHYSLIKQIDVGDGLVVCDFSPLQDMAYADVNLSAPRREVFETLYQHLVSEIGEPDLLVHLICAAEEELKRIRRRARVIESSIQLDYLDDLNRAISARIVHAGARVVTIDSEANDFAHDRQVQAEVVNLILAEAVATRCSSEPASPGPL